MPLPATMRALCFDGGLSLTEMPLPEPRSGHALLRLTLAGICRTDLEIIKGYMGFSGVLGHEFTARVVHSPEPAWQEARVVGEINLGCGDCPECRRGMDRHCTSRQVLGIAGHDGALAGSSTPRRATAMRASVRCGDARRRRSASTLRWR